MSEVPYDVLRRHLIEEHLIDDLSRRHGDMMAAHSDVHFRAEQEEAGRQASGGPSVVTPLPDGLSVTLDGHTTQVRIHRSAGTDDAVVVFIDTDYEPDGSDGPGLRVLVNDDLAFVGVDYGDLCEVCGGDDHLLDGGYGRTRPPFEEYRIVQRCDECGRFPSDLAAAEDYADRNGGGVVFAIGDGERLAPASDIFVALNSQIGETVVKWIDPDQAIANDWYEPPPATDRRGQKNTR